MYEEIGGDKETPEAREQRELARLVQDHGGEITARELMHASRQYRESAEDAEAALRGLVADGVAKVHTDTKSNRGGRPVDVFTLLDGAAGNTTPVNPEKSEVVLPGEDVEEMEFSPPIDTPQDNEVTKWEG